MIGDVKMEVTCDRDKCEDFIEISPEYVFAGRSESSGHYDTSKRSLRKLVESEGWFLGADNCATYCPEHKPDEDERGLDFSKQPTR